MKTTIAGLIPNTPCSVLVGLIMFAGVSFMSSRVSAGVDDWPSTPLNSSSDPLVAYFAEQDPEMVSLACRPSVQVSLDQNGQALITPQMLVVAPAYPLNMYVVDIMGPLTNVVTCAQIGQEVMASVQELPTGNFCMSTLIVEDKLKPVLTCLPDTIPCNTDVLALDYLEFLDNVVDNCDDDPAVWFEYYITDLNCDPSGFAGYVDVTYHATDNYGNSSTCDKRIWLEKFSLMDVDFPADTVLNCDGANPDPEVIGGPTINGEPISHFCELVAWNTDNVIPMCSGQKKIIRLWKVMDWCTGAMISDPQEILIVDTVPPVIVCPANITLGTSALSCSANYTLPTVSVSDVCSDNALIVVRFTVSGVPGIFNSGQQVTLGLGPHTVTVSATDNCNNTATCHYTVTVVDDDSPVVVCTNLNIPLDAMGMAFLNANSSAFNATDNCGVVLRRVRRMTDNCNTPANLVFDSEVKFCCADVGQDVMVFFEASDAAGNVSTCMITVTVKDNIPPTALCRNTCLFLNGNGMVTLPPDSIDNGSFDNCQIVNRQVSKTSFTCADIGTQPVILTVTDEAGNTATCSAQVEVKDTVPPVALCRDITVQLNEMGMVTITVNMVNNGSFDNCALDTLYITEDMFTCADVGPNQVDLIVFDDAGLSDTCTATVTVMEMPPMVMCMDVTVYLDENGDVMITPDDVDAVSDDCSMPNREVNPDTFDCSDVGENIVTLTATDGSGLTATCTAVVTVVDSLPPICNTMDITIQLDADGSVTVPGNAVNDGSTDNCAIQSITINPNTFDCDDTGAPVVVIQTVTDVNGNTSTCSASVTVEDNIDPICSTMNIVVQLNAAGMVTIMNNAVNDGSSDNCGIESIVLNQTSFDCDDVGVVEVIQTVTDVNGNSSTCTALVTVEDNVAPTCTTQDITVQLNANGMVSIGNTAVNNGSSDACGILSITVTPATFDCDDVGVVIVVQTVTDVNGNTSSCTASVTVEDNLAPTCLTMDITVELGPDGTATIPGNAVDDGSFDNCGIQMISVDPDMFDCNSPGVVVVVQTVTDINGNTSTCTANVTVTGGDEPEAFCQDITVFLNNDGIVIIDPNDIDNGSFSLCGNIELTVDPDTLDCEDIGENVVILTVTDITGSSATCSATVTVVDNLPPDCQAQDITVFLDENGMASIDAGDIDDDSSDNCGIDMISVTPDEFDCGDVGTVVVVLTVTDVNGNTSTCTATVTVVDDIGPICMAQDITVILDGTGNATINASQIDDGSSDNCEPIMLSVTPSSFDCDDIGENEVVLTVTDVSGNTSTCTAIVTVEDPGGLVASCQNLTVFLNANGMVVVTPNQINNGSGGGCNAGMLTFELSETNFDCQDVGPNMVVLTVTDAMGNTATCTAIITVVDNTPPTIMCPANMNADCDDPININNLGSFGTPVTSDNCLPVALEQDVQDNRNDCGQGTIIRTFTATDPSGNTSTCVQVITVGDPDPFDVTDIIWPPANVNLGQCTSTNPGPGNQPVIDAGTCTNISVGFSDIVTTIVDNNPATPCVQITRTWTVIDSCQLMQGTQNGIFMFTQMITQNDFTPPVFVQLNDITVNANPSTCVGTANLIASAMDCGMPTPITNNFNMGGANASGTFPIGTTTVIFTSSDACGNISTMDVNVTVIDPNPAMIQCEKIIRHMNEELEVAVLAEDFITFTPGACTTIDDFLFSYDPTDPFDSIMFFGCQVAGGVEPVMIYTFDLNGNPVDTCRADLDFRDTMDLCGNGLTATGMIFNENKAMLSDVPVLISEPLMETSMTNANGRYVYRNLEEGQIYTLTPFLNVNHKQGVTTQDLIAIQKHLLGIKSLDSPYKLIAADATNNGMVSISDLLEIRKLLLGTIPAFTYNTSWRFLDAQYEFPDPQNPWMLTFPETMTFDPIVHHMTQQDFIGVKIGDVNNSSARLQSEDVEVRSGNALVIAVEDRLVKPGDVIDVPVTVMHYEGLVGYQFSLNFNPAYAELLSVTLPPQSFLDKEWFGLDQADLGTINALYYEPSPRMVNSGQVLFNLEFRANRNMKLSDILTLDAQGLRPEAYDATEGVMPVRLAFDGRIADLEFVVYQNLPNPFSDGTVIPVQVPEASDVRLEIYSYDGRLVHSQTTHVETGYHEFVVEGKDLDTGGIYYYTVSTDQFRGTRKLIYLR